MPASLVQMRWIGFDKVTVFAGIILDPPPCEGSFGGVVSRQLN